MSTVSSPVASKPDANVALTLGAVISVLLLASLGQTIITTALPIIVADLGGLEHISWAITAYLLAATVAAPIYGKLGDLFGRKIVLQVGILIFLSGSLLSALSSSMEMLVVGRFVQGIGGGGLIVTAMASVGDVLPPRQRGKAQGVVGAAFGLSTVIGPFLGGFIVETLSWPWLFAVNLPVGLLALGVIAVAFKGRPERIARKIDYLGALTLATFLSSIVLYTTMGGTILPWTSPAALGLLALAVVALIGFILVERRAEEPIIPLGLFRVNAFVVANSVGFAVGTLMFGAITFVPFFLQVVKGFTPMQAGLSLLPMMVGLIGASNAAGWAMARTGRYRRLPIFSTALATIGAMLLATIEPHTSVVLIMAYMLIVGLGIGPIMSVGITAIQNAVPHNVLGVATASVQMFRQTGGTIGVAVLGAIFANRLAVEVGVSNGGGALLDPEAIAAMPPDIHAQLINGYAAALHPVFWVAAAAAAIGFVASWFLREIPLSDALPSRQKEEPVAVD